MKAFAALSPDVRKAMGRHHRLVQGAIAAIAHKNMGLQIDGPLRGIGCFNGGIAVNGYEIIIKEQLVCGGGIQEETAVVDAINMLRTAWEIDGENVLTLFSPIETGDPLRTLLDLETYETV